MTDMLPDSATMATAFLSLSIVMDSLTFSRFNYRAALDLTRRLLYLIWGLQYGKA